MRRVRLDSLQDCAGKLILQDQPFDGVAYEVKSDRVMANYRVTNGVPAAPAEEWDPSRPRVLVGALTLVSAGETNRRFPEEGVYLDGSVFDGFAYVFDAQTGILLQEQDLRPGTVKQWYPSGVMKAELDRVRADGAFEAETWHENGRSAGIESLELGYGYTPEGRLRTLRVSSDCPSADLDRLTFRVDSMLDLAGQGITDAVIDRLKELSRVEDLELHRTTISANGLARFCACTNLKSLRTRKNTGFGEQDVRTLLARLSACVWDGRIR